MCMHSTVLSRSRDKGVPHTGHANPGAVQSETFECQCEFCSAIYYLFVCLLLALQIMGFYMRDDS